MKLKAFPIVAVLGTIAAVAAGCVVNQRPADSTPQTAQPPPPAPATAAPAETAAPAATETAAPAATTPPPGRMLSKPKAPDADAGAADGG
jgi:hypothetical protein